MRIVVKKKWSAPVGEAFFFYPESWRASRAVSRMSLAERGVYLELLIEQWLKGSIPDDAQAAADAIATTPNQVQEVIEAFPIVKKKFPSVPNGNGALRNKRLEQVRRDRQKWIKQRKAAAATRWKVSKKDAVAMRSHSGRNAIAMHKHPTRRDGT